jgi:hypothetical protein
MPGNGRELLSHAGALKVNRLNLQGAPGEVTMVVYDENIINPSDIVGCL